MVRELPLEILRLQLADRQLQVLQLHLLLEENQVLVLALNVNQQVEDDVDVEPSLNDVVVLVQQVVLNAQLLRATNVSGALHGWGNIYAIMVYSKFM